MKSGPVSSAGLCYARIVWRAPSLVQAATRAVKLSSSNSSAAVEDTEDLMVDWRCDDGRERCNER